LKKHHYPFEKTLIAHTDFKQTSVIRAIDKWIKLKNKPDAIFCISDKCAIYALKHLKSKNIKVPEEICVAGFGNDLIGALIEPALTTYDVKTIQIGEMAMQLFMDQILSENEFKPRIKVINGNLIIRGSTLKSAISNMNNSPIL
jgi:LacI family transcriptional regulator